MSKNRFPADQYDDVKDIVTSHKSTGSDDEINIFYDPNGQEIPQHQMDMIQENQDLIRREVQNPSGGGLEPPSPEDDPTSGGAVPGDVIHANFGGQQPNSPDLGVEYFAGVPPAGRVNVQAARQAQKLKNFLATTPEKGQISSLERARYLQMRVQRLLVGMEKRRANSISLDRELRSHASEYTKILLSEASENAADRFSISEGGLRLLQRGLIAGEVPEIDELERLGKFLDEQDIVNVLNVPEIQPRAGYTTNPRYLKDGQPGFGPYDSPDEDTVVSVFALADPDNWKLSPDDRAYLIDVLQTDKLDKYKHKPGPSGAKYFWNRKPFKIPLNLYVKQEIVADTKEIYRSGQTVEQARLAQMADPQTRERIDHSTTIIDWWTNSASKSYLTTSTSDKTNKDQIILCDIQDYARARLDLDRRLP